MVSKLAVAVLAASAMVGMSAAVPSTPISVMHGTSYQAPAQQQEQRAAPAQVITARDELERSDALRLFPGRHRREWDGQNRKAGDRAHKRMKRARASGRR